jgi:hypothetical protein
MSRQPRIATSLPLAGIVRKNADDINAALAASAIRTLEVNNLLGSQAPSYAPVRAENTNAFRSQFATDK